ncbi:hypothetical protein FKM82_027949, partial [Ascaphus truei]
DFHPSSMVQQNQNKICDSLAEDEPPVVAIPPFCDTSSRKAFSPVSEMSISTLTSHSDEAGIQEDPASEADDGPEYLAIGNMCRRTSTQSSGSSSGSNLFSSCSSLKPESLGRCTPAPPGSSLLRVARRSSFSEGQTGSGQSSARKSHTRSHSDTNVATGKPQGGDRTITMILEDPTAGLASNTKQTLWVIVLFTSEALVTFLQQIHLLLPPCSVIGPNTGRLSVLEAQTPNLRDNQPTLISVHAPITFTRLSPHRCYVRFVLET